jgi:hypothetical protein
MMTDKCRACGSTDNNGWLLETVIDYETNLVTSREVPCAACETRRTEPVPVQQPTPVRTPAPAPSPVLLLPVYESEPESAQALVAKR